MRTSCNNSTGIYTTTGNAIDESKPTMKYNIGNIHAYNL